MKIQKRFYTGIPIPIRARNLHTASSPLSFFDSPPTPPPTTPRNANIVRFAAESKGLGSALCGFDVVRRGWEGPYVMGVDVRVGRREGKSRERKGRKLILDVGGYGIPKRCMSGSVGGKAVMVGEDAFFVRRNAMGVADGVGGWARGQTIPGPTPSALFAHRLMHFCSEEMELEPPRPSTFIPSVSFARRELQEELEEELEELEEGIDVLMILERAYEKTIKAHVEKEQPISYSPFSPPPPPDTLSSPIIPSDPTPKPLLAGSSTALLAVLDHVNNGEAVVKIAHVGDCMGMLVRGTECVWRSDEMWWSFNTPVQLGPTTPAQPSTTAHVFALPVQEDDILILATDGLSDNLWDEDILDEVARFQSDHSSEEGGRDMLAAGMLSEALCSRAKRVAKDGEGDTPFGRRATEEGRKWKGGKNDDISVVVAVISRAGERR
ncbi:protein serine/threonine phosphatase 2C [Armillaria solidipes]|uniref:Protein phosphatase n=1 Tax=Armillaria solidipes TaxID=1076256 RepID=A0A2H3AVD3_9AGAR|nr:protein serine/threonine phosphatase 2C [Armillaria solidipes]